jgi:hypothetical protein
MASLFLARPRLWIGRLSLTERTIAANEIGEQDSTHVPPERGRKSREPLARIDLVRR